MNRQINYIRSTAIPLPQENIDTDQIIPARFLKRTETDGWGDYLFRDWRYKNGEISQPDSSFILNQTAYKSRILVAGHNFGCGSSREHAAWALKQYGIDAVISSGFADIFHTNALNNFLLPVTVSLEFLEQVFDTVKKDPDTEVFIDLDGQSVTIQTLNFTELFEINDYKKACFLHGLDDIDFLVSALPEIKTYQQNHNKLTTY